MNWTTTKPAKPGWYWWKDTQRPGRAFIVSVVNDGYGLTVYGLDEYNRRLYEVKGEWSSEPIPEPAEREERETQP